MLIQAMWTCGIWEVELFIYDFLLPFMTKLFGESAEIPSRIFINSYAIFTSTVLPTVHFIYSKQTRDFVKHHLHNVMQSIIKN